MGQYDRGDLHDPKILMACSARNFQVHAIWGRSQASGIDQETSVPLIAAMLTTSRVNLFFAARRQG
jgi:hypothetical protein